MFRQQFEGSDVTATLSGTRHSALIGSESGTAAAGRGDFVEGGTARQQGHRFSGSAIIRKGSQHGIAGGAHTT